MDLFVSYNMLSYHFISTSLKQAKNNIKDCVSYYYYNHLNIAIFETL